MVIPAVVAVVVDFQTDLSSWVVLLSVREVQPFLVILAVSYPLKTLHTGRKQSEQHIPV